MRNLREAHFPGESLRRVGERLADRGAFNPYFYTQLNKIEMGVILPSSELLGRILVAYGATVAQKQRAFEEYAASATLQALRIAAEDIGVESHDAEKAVGAFYRKVKRRV